MSKSKKNKKSKGAVTSWDALAVATVTTIGNAVGQLIADGAERIASRGGFVGSGANGATPPPPVVPVPPAPQRDITAELLRLLESGGDKSIADLVAAGVADLTGTLAALRTARELGLVEVDESRGRVQLTDSGRRTVAALSGESRAEGEAKENAEAFPE